MKFSSVSLVLLAMSCAVCGTVLAAAREQPAMDAALPARPAVSVIAPMPYNEVILQQIAEMPQGGGYAGSHQAKVGLMNAVQLTLPGLSFSVDRARPSFCSGATYLVFLKTIEALRRRGDVALDTHALAPLRIADQRDGQGVWGRWNANGPGTARLFHELDLGPNFDDFTQARPGDFMKIFWTTAVGQHEHGHSVIYRGTTVDNGVESVRFWSSNTGAGYGEKTVPRTKIAAVIFSRLISPRNLTRAPMLTPFDPYLASLLTKDSSLEEAYRLCGMR